MKTIVSTALAAALLGVAGGCGHLDLDTIGSGSHVLTGTVVSSTGDSFPDGAVLDVRVIDLAPPPPPTPLQTSAAPKIALPPEIVGEQTVALHGGPPYAFKVDYTADDDALRRGLAIEARVSYGGRLQYSNLTRYTVGIDDADESQQISVDKM